MRYLVAIPVPEPWRSTLTEVKRAFRPTGWRDTMDPHITLLAPDHPLLPFDEAAAAFVSAELKMSHFIITANQPDHFSRRHHRTLVLRAEPQATLAKLFFSLTSASVWQSTLASTRRDYVSHITIANQLPILTAPEAETALTKLALSVVFDCRLITLYAKRSNWPKWQELAHKQLD
jgi:2'-5' RNA ligase